MLSAVTTGERNSELDNHLRAAPFAQDVRAIVADDRTSVEELAASGGVHPTWRPK